VPDDPFSPEVPEVPDVAAANEVPFIDKDPDILTDPVNS
jgi:hypothetical protein